MPTYNVEMAFLKILERIIAPVQRHFVYKTVYWLHRSGTIISDFGKVAILWEMVSLLFVLLSSKIVLVLVYVIQKKCAVILNMYVITVMVVIIW